MARPLPPGRRVSAPPLPEPSGGVAARFAALTDVTPFLDPTLLGLAASALAFGAVFLARRS
jgi:hypothetical protein